MFYVVTEYLLVEVTVTIPLVPPSLSVVVLLIMPLLTFPLSVEVKNMASTKHSPATGGGRNVYLGLYYIVFGGGWENSTEDDRSSVIGGTSNIVNSICACISEVYQNEAIGDSTSVSGRLKHYVDSKLGRSVTVSAGMLSNDGRGLLRLTSSSSSFSSGGGVTMVGI